MPGDYELLRKMNPFEKSNQTVFYTNEELEKLGWKTAETPKKKNPQKPGEIIDGYIQGYIKELLNRDSTGSSNCEYIATDNFAEVVEKLCIVHTRMWYLEDQIGFAKNNDEIASLKTRIDQCFKVKRPKLVEALNKLIEAAVLQGKSLYEPSVKLYKGFDSEKVDNQEKNL